jgi:DNA helicase-2/ATP-dependent DNA helicase PcrA
MTILLTPKSSETSGQSEPFVAPSKTIKIFGPPGTGKTTFLLETLERHLKDGYHPSQISFISFTKSAVQEARSRIAQRFTSYSLEKDFKWFRTLHSMCCLKLGIRRFEVLSSQERVEFGRKYGWDITNMGLEASLHGVRSSTPHDLVLHSYDLARVKKTKVSDEMLSLDCDVSIENAKQLIMDYEKFKDEQGRYDFTDMLTEAVGKGPIGAKIVMVDEAQDLTPLQLDLVREFSGGADYLYLAGDDDQAIYTFQGADEYGFLRFPCNEEIVLERSHRVPEEIGGRAALTITKVEHRHVKGSSWNESTGKLHITHDWTSLPWEKMDGRDTFVLCRHNTQVEKAIEFLKEKGIVAYRGDVDPVSKDYREALELFKHYKLYGRELNSQDWAKIFKGLGRKNEATQIRKKISVLKDVTWKDFKANPYYELIKDKPLRKPTIHIGTMHWSKGREADIVVLLSDCNYRVYRAMNDTERRLCYVAMTRARKHLFICQPESRHYLEPLLEA